MLLIIEFATFADSFSAALHAPVKSQRCFSSLSAFGYFACSLRLSSRAAPLTLQDDIMFASSTLPHLKYAPPPCSIWQAHFPSVTAVPVCRCSLTGCHYVER